MSRKGSALRIALLVPAVAAIAAAVPPADPPASLDALERRIPELMRAGDVPGLQIAVIRGGRAVWRHAFGVRDAASNAPVGDDTVFEAASLSIYMANTSIAK